MKEIDTKTSVLYHQLRDAYSVSNLNRICLTLIRLYKEKKFSVLRQLAEAISDWQKIEIAEDGKGFSKFMMLYHPDRSIFALQSIDQCYMAGDNHGLSAFTHILVLEDIEGITEEIHDWEDIDYSPVYAWDADIDGYYTDEDDSEEDYSAPLNNAPVIGLSFYDAVKIRIYGHTDVEFPTEYLEDWDEIEMAESGLDDLDGIEYCIHTISMDLSGNNLTDLSPLWDLSRLENLNLSFNQISLVDPLANLVNLKSLQISHNHIEDLSPLLDLDFLEYLDVCGNPVSYEQIAQLRKKGVEVLSD